MTDSAPEPSHPQTGTAGPSEPPLAGSGAESPSALPRETQWSIAAWCDATFGPVANNATTAARANKEMAELVSDLAIDPQHPGAAEEIADVVIALMRLATHLGSDLQREIDRKMKINRARQWRRDGVGHGYHVK